MDVNKFFTYYLQCATRCLAINSEYSQVCTMFELYILFRKYNANKLLKQPSQHSSEYIKLERPCAYNISNATIEQSLHAERIQEDNRIIV